MAESEMIVGELASFGGSLRLRDGDILVVKVHKNLNTAGFEAVRKIYEKELTRLGIADPKVLAVPGEISFEVIERQ